jgi:hypothetical protein
LALQAIKNSTAYVNKKYVFIIHMAHKCARVKILVFSRTKNAQMEFLKMLGTDFE